MFECPDKLIHHERVLWFEAVAANHKDSGEAP